LSSEQIVFKLNERMFQGFQFLALILAGVICFAVHSFSKAASPNLRRQFASTAFFMVLPLTFAVGTANNYWRVATSASFFLTLSSFSLLSARHWSPISWRHLLPLAVSSLVMTIVIVENGMEHPYRDPNPLMSSTVPVQIGPAGDMLLVNSNIAAYLEELRRLSRNAGFQSGTPMIDLTGHYPGSLYALGAKPVGAAWLIGGYSGSDRLAAANLDVVPCQELVRSWVLIEPEGPLRLSTDVLRKYGIDPENDLEIVGALDSPIGALPTSYKQELLKPRPAVQNVLSSCETTRSVGN
jgi:hypothetical protein